MARSVKLCGVSVSTQHGSNSVLATVYITAAPVIAIDSSRYLENGTRYSFRLAVTDFPYLLLGKYYDNSREAAPSADAQNEVEAEWLWTQVPYCMKRI